MSAIIIEHDLVHYEAIGRGHPVVFVHGWMGSWRYWWSTMQAISAFQFRAYAFDLWGFGDSGKRRERYDFDAYVGLLGEFMDQLGLPATTLVGHSLGAAVALRYACEQPEWVDRVMTVGLPIPEQLGTSPSAFVSRLTSRRGDSGYAEIDAEMGKTDDLALLQSAQTVLSSDVMLDVKECTKPHLLVYGGKDPIVPAPTDGWLTQIEQVCRQVSLDQSMHFPMLDEAAKFTRLLVDFVDAGDDLNTIEVKEQWRRRTH